MKVALFTAITVPLLAAAHSNHHAREFIAPRQAPPSGSSPAPTPSPPISAAPSSGSSGAPAAGSSGSSISALPTFSFALAATNPTAVPVSQITSGEPSAATLPLTTTVPPGATPTYFTGAPPLPDLSTVLPANYPPLDKPPPTDSPEVQQWIAEVNASGVVIPNIAPTLAGGCPANLQAAADQSRCWWTCGGCVRTTDVTTCPDKLTWGLTHDDGPAPYTPNLLQYLNSVNLTTTFFNVGSRVISYPNTIRDAYMAGHQVAVHTWSHPSMTTLTNEEVIAELGWTKKVMKDVLGVTPLYWRPPYGDIDDRVRAIGQAMNLIPVMWTRISPTATFDTGDFNIAGGLDSVSEVLFNWENIVGNATTLQTGFIVLEHDLFQQSVQVATGYILPAALANNPPLKIQPVISCLHKTFNEAYIETNDNKTNPLPLASVSGSASPSGGGGGAQAGGGSGASDTGGAVAAGVAGNGLFVAAGTAAFAVLAGLGAFA